MITPQYFTTKDLIFHQEELEYSNAETIHQFMVESHGIDYDKNPVWVELEALLEATMMRVENWWVCK